MNSLATAFDILLSGVIVAILVRIAVSDFKTQKIRNREVLWVGLAGAAKLVLHAWQSGAWRDAELAVGAAVLLFVLLFPFWLARKVGAGEVKFIAVAPLVAGGENLPVFCLTLLALTIVTALAVKNPLLLPAPVFRQYLEHFDRKGVVPFGVPIAGALLVVTMIAALGLFKMTEL